jgi:sialate O-acetylesterase
MQALITGWRKVWGQDQLPFYYVQLARMPQKNDPPWQGDGLTPTREAQLKSLAIPHTGMAVIIDLPGDAGWHPRNKQDVAKRLSLWALHNDYGREDLVFSGPLYKSLAVEENRIRIRFNHLGSGLMVGTKDGLQPVKPAPDQPLRSFAVAGGDRKWVLAKAEIDGYDVVVSSPEVPKPIAVRYAYCQDPEGANLYNKEGLPASPFRTDDW